MYEDLYCADWREGKGYAAHEREQRSMRIPRAVRRWRLTRTVSVREAATLLGVSEQRIRQLLSAGRIEGARRGKGRNHPWGITAYLDTTTSVYRIRLLPGTRGPENRNAPRVPI